MSGARYTLDDLLMLMAVLRDPQQGCPWDVKQDWDSIVPHTIEEAYEVADAIERRAFDELPGELGDLLFQVIYYSQFGSEEGRFGFHDIVHVLTEKMLRRHPHVFPDGHLQSRREGVSAADVETHQVNSRWESLKQREREARVDTGHGYPSALDDVPRALPAMTRAMKLSKRTARVGFDWPDTRGVMAKLEEELGEIQQALDAGDKAHAAEELGDLLFAAVNLARRLGVDPERCLRGTNQRFEQRFRYLESALADEGIRLEDAELEQMEHYWQAAKRASK
ncbi:nucleoside triphosphate pyrophosphohydrolase [Halomonas huangheensis]|uniref:Nucleoside triphosphate pyrophosphohydrolase n=1 Tax=Halomonas huangheensis TaxID=1178482 RepID=W1N345_9GAMM|nr:nucleoside triphosphate pyrophosphohydrolase [Halomonas huangheensis]ALM52211.1 nucleoside triphosphate hydrolase [Halomonas huangheensis]ERL49375.1 ArpR [Halomonas huangheensis]